MGETIMHKDRGSGGIFLIKEDTSTLSELTYRKLKNIITITQTNTKPSLEGKGLASKLVSKVVEFARANEYKINPLCPFSEVQFDRNPGYRDVLAS